MIKHDKQYWILEMKFDVIESCIHMVLTLNPDEGTRDHEVTIRKILNFIVRRYHEPNKACYGDYERWTIISVGEKWKYKMDTGDAIVTFETLQKIDL